MLLDEVESLFDFATSIALGAYCPLALFADEVLLNKS
jgi:hypothetical protein